MDRQFKRILDLVRRTGDRLVVTDPDGEEAYVVMGLEQYEEILSGAEQHRCSLDDEEDDGAEIDWKPQDYGDLVDLESEQEERQSDVPAGDASLPDDLKEAVEHDLAILEAWRKETDSAAGVDKLKKGQEKLKSGDDEERFYLEPIE